MKIQFDLHGNWCNEYPWITISHNSAMLYQGHVEERQQLEFDLPYSLNNHVCIAGLGKLNGEHGQWDTRVDDQGQITHDKNMIIHDIRIEGISMGIEWIRDLPMHSNNGTVEPCLLGMYANGYIEFVIQQPVLSWIIDEKFIKRERQLAFESHQRSGQDRFEYEFVAEKIARIKNLIHAHHADR